MTCEFICMTCWTFCVSKHKDATATYVEMTDVLFSQVDINRFLFKNNTTYGGEYRLVKYLNVV